MLDDALREELRSYMARTGETIYGIGKKLGISDALIYSWYAGRTETMQLKNAGKICEHIGVWIFPVED